MTLPFVLSLPHGAKRIPEDLSSEMALSNREIEASVDTGTTEIFAGLPARAIVQAEWHRLVADLNRDASALDPKGVIPQIDYHGRTVYRPGCLPEKEAMDRRIRRYYQPFHQQLESALRLPGVAGLFDCHSMNGIGPREAPDRGKRRKDIVLGNNGDSRGGARPSAGLITCPSDEFRTMAGIFESCGFSVALNDPYSGGFITTHYGHLLMREQRFAVQIEINQDLVLQPATGLLVMDQVRDVRTRVERALQKIADGHENRGHLPS